MTRKYKRKILEACFGSSLHREFSASMVFGFLFIKTTQKTRGASIEVRNVTMWPS